GRNPGTGKQMQKSIYGDSQQEVAKQLRQIQAAIDNGTYIEPSKMTVEQWLEIWLDEYLGNVKPGTVSNYSQHVKNHIIPAIGSVKLNALQPAAIQRMYNQIQKNGLSPKTIKNLHGALHRAMQTAVRLGYIRTNPTGACILPRIEKKKIQPLDKPEITKFLDALKGHRNEALFKVALFSGMRSGELLGLTWDCVQFDDGTIYVCKQLTAPRKKGGSYSFAPLKNDKPRTITPAPTVMQLLREHKKNQTEQRLRVGGVWGEKGLENLVFTNEAGKHLTQCGVWKELQKVFTQAEIDPRPFHDLRHSYAVNSIRSGDDVKTIQENLGHHTAAFTLDVYGHVTEQMKRESADRMEQFIESVKSTS
ncbi:MAG: site-specific integrase, partial [Clostridiales bacterium]|nr:site-specific integrase [Clostridiales bacterium]